MLKVLFPAQTLNEHYPKKKINFTSSFYESLKVVSP